MDFNLLFVPLLSLNCEPGINCDLSISAQLSEKILFIKICNTNIHFLPKTSFVGAH